jgi:hypothetical protein
MKTLFVLLVMLMGSWSAVHAQTSPDYDAALIPDSLKTNAHVVLRESEENFTVFSPSKATNKVHKVVTVLDEQGKSELMFYVWSFSFVKLDDASINVYDAKGTPIQHIKERQMTEEGYGEGLIDDAQVTYFSVAAPAYPITLEINYTVNYKGLEKYPSFVLDNTERSIQQSSYILTIPKSMNVRYQDPRLTVQPQVSDSDKASRIYTWKVSGIKAVSDQAWSASNIVPQVYIAPTQFEMGGLAGQMSTWREYGQWIYDLNKETFALPDASKQFYKDMVAGAVSDRDKARIIYSYLQKNFRYVSIQLGIGGLRSFPATFTEKKKYEDCKALSTYMSACLDAVGVKSYTALINAGSREAPVDAAFPHDGFDHVILCIPQPKDSIWLECTSKYTDFGVLGDFTENRYALLITEKGGVLVHTPSSSSYENRTFTYTTVHLAADGSGKADISHTAEGDIKFDEVGKLYEETHDKQKRFLVDDMEFIQPDDFSVALKQIDSPVLKSQFQMTFEKIPEFTSGDKMFLNPRLYHIWQLRIPEDSSRTNDFYFERPFETADTTCYQLPEGYVVDNLPKGKTFSCPYASYISTYWYDASQKAVFTYGRLVLKNREIRAKDYTAVRKFFSDVTEDETEKIVITKP